MRSRAFNKRVEIWGLTAVSDGFGGNTLTETLLATSWAKIETTNPNRSDLGGIAGGDGGILDATSSIIITMRKRDDLTIDMQTQFIKYAGVKYVINSNAIDLDFKDSFIKVVCTKES